MTDELEVKLARPDDLGPLRDVIWDMLVLADRDFVPRLSSRHDTTTMELDSPTAFNGPIEYFDSLLAQHFLIATVGEKVVGMMSFRPHYQDEKLAPYVPSTHVTTTIVKMANRRQGIGSALNHATENLPEDLASPYITRRTWSTNYANVELLTGLGFKELLRVSNHRGNGIDTIYFGRTTRPTTPPE